MKSIVNHIFLFIFLSSTSIFAQWTYDNIGDLKQDVIIRYDVIYDKELTEEDKKSQDFYKEIVIYLNQRYLLQEEIKNNNSYKYFILLDYKKEKGSNCFVFKDYKSAIPHGFEIPQTEGHLEEGKEKDIAGLKCEKYTSIFRGQPVDLFTTKEIGLRYVNDYNIPGFLMQYRSYNPVLGFYTVKARNVERTQLPYQVYSQIYTLKEYKLTTNKRHEKAIKKYIEKVREENALKKLNRQK